MTLRAILNNEEVNQISAVAAEHGKVMIVFTSNTCRVGEVLGEYSSRAYVKDMARSVRRRKDILK